MALPYATITPQRRARVEEARRLRAEGLLQREIGERMGLGRAVVSELLSDPWREKAQARRIGYGGTCKDCGAATDGSAGVQYAPDYCGDCMRRRQHHGRYWTKERILEAVHRFAEEYGRQPTSTEWLAARDCEKPEWAPYTGTVLGEFGSWAAAMHAAGFESRVGIKIRKARKRTPTERTVGMFHVLTQNGENEWKDLGVFPGNRQQAVNQALTENPPQNGDCRVTTVQTQSWIESPVKGTQKIVYEIVGADG